jgi:ABC-type antimicrobial peptide transport system permease subunit
MNVLARSRGLLVRLKLRRREGLRFVDMARVAWNHIRERAVFFYANVVAISVGILLVVVMLSMSTGLSRYVEMLLRSEASAEMIEVTTDPRGGTAAPLTLRTLQSFGAIGGVRQIVPMVDSIFAELRGSRADAFIALASTTGRGDAEVERNVIIAGSMAAMRSENTIVIPVNVASELGIVPPVAAAGRKLILHVTRSGRRGEESLDLPLTVVAVARQTRFSRSYAPLTLMRRIARWQNNRQLSDAEAFTERFDPTFLYDGARLYARSVDDVAPLRAQLEQRGYHTASILDSVKRYRQIMSIARVVLTSLGLIALFTGSISIFNAAYAAVLRRMREFAIYKTYGATQRAILAIVLAEAVITALVSGLLGFAAGGVVCWLLQRAVRKEVDTILFPIEPWLIGAALGVACVAAISASLVPARRAAQLSPTEALRIG